MHRPPSTILVADDHEGIRKGLRVLLDADPRFRIIGEAGEGHEALAMVQKTKPDIAIIDYSLPGLNGAELTRNIKNNVPNTEVLIYTIHDEEDIVSRSLRAGARGYVLKSDSCSHLLAALDALAGKLPYLSEGVVGYLTDHMLQQEKHSPSGLVLTAEEIEVVKLVVGGDINKDIAENLCMAPRSLESMRVRIMKKLNIRSTAQLVRYAVRNFIVKV